jgi:DNA-binding Lrp family transcriptional regulator
MSLNTQDKQMPNPLKLSLLQQEIINNFQKDFPLCSQPFQAIAQMLSNEVLSDNQLNCNEQQIISAIEALNQLGVLSRVGPVFDHKKAGASTLAAIAAPPEQLDKIAGIVNQFEQVNHNYAREHDYNLWFVVTASDPMALAETLQEIELLTGLPILVLPMEASYHIDLGFKINFAEYQHKPLNKKIINDKSTSNKLIDNTEYLNQAQQVLLRTMIEKGLPITSKPFADIAVQLNVVPARVIKQIDQWQNNGLIRRFGLVVKHRQLGFNANAMVVWNIPDECVDVIAGQLSKFDEVSLCYRRPRRLPDWPYNLFCMIHGTDREIVLAQITKITQQLISDNSDVWQSTSDIQQDILFSTKAYKQHGARYSKRKIKKDISSIKAILAEKEQAHG